MPVTKPEIGADEDTWGGVLNDALDYLDARIDTEVSARSASDTAEAAARVSGDADAVPKTLVDAKGDLLVGSAADTVIRKAVGADDLVLTASAASSGGVTWAAAVSPTLVDAKGDLLVGSAADTLIRKAVGANDTVLTADSTAAGGVKWATPGAASEEAWHSVGGGGEPAFEGTWANAGGAYQTLQFKKVGNEVRIRGVVSGVGGIIFTLPSGYRPPATQDFATTTQISTVIARSEVLADGRVSFASTTGDTGATNYGLCFSFWID